jgi:hypothetical protein
VEWTVSVDDNGDGGRAHVKGNMIVGAAAFDSSDLGYFANFMNRFLDLSLRLSIL